MFSPLSKPTPTKKFLYEMSAHSTDSIWYVHNCSDTNITDIWYKVYEEMYYSAYDTSSLTKIDTILNRVNNLGADTIPIGIMNYSFYGLKTDAMSTNTYFNFDTINNVLSDKNPRPSFPYTDNNTIFMSAPLSDQSSFANPVYVINPKFFFYDVFNADKFTKTSTLQINFGDNTGWHNYDPTIISYYQPNYGSNNSNPTITVRQVNTGTAGVYGTSQSRFIVGAALNVPPDETIIIPGLNVGVYNGCKTTQQTGKTVIYLEGIDPLDVIPNKNRNIPRIYDEMLHNNNIIQLKNQGYKFVVVDWQSSGIDMRFNALYVVNLIQELKRRSTDDEQFILMGESMGGIVGRYALTYMESREYQAQNTAPFFTEQSDVQSLTYLNQNPIIFSLPSNWVERDKMHNTRLFISVDAPHRGANIPLSIQKAYTSAFKLLPPYLGAFMRISSYANNLFLDSKASKQLLIEHVSTEAGLGFYKTYSSAPVRTSFMRQLDAMGSYPQFAKIVLMTNGAMDATGQKNYYTNKLRTPNDRLMQFRADLYLKVLGIKVPLLGCNLDARTNPDGSGQIFAANAGTFKIRVKLKWFGVKVFADYNSFFNFQNYATTRPYCTSAGSINGRVRLAGVSATASSSTHNISKHWLLNLFSYSNTSNGLGCERFKAHYGLNGFASTNFDYSLCTDGPFWGFIPVQSALDYGRAGTLNLNTNIEALDINTKLANIPARADVIMGSRNGGNEEHLVLRNNGIVNVSSVSPTFPNFDNTYFSCLNIRPEVGRGILNLEIGDEELFLENNSLPYRAEYQVEYDIHLNERNRFYQYPSSIVSSTILPRIYSKQDLFSITNTGFATFIYDNTSAPGGTVLNHLGFYGTTTGTFNLVDQQLVTCCINFLLKGGQPLPIFKNKPIPTELSYLKAYPNPNSGELLTLQYQFKTAGTVKMVIRDGMGKIIYSSNYFVPIGKQAINSVINLKALNIPAGLYFIQLENNNEVVASKVVVMK